MLAQQLGVAGPRLVTDIAVSPISQPSLNKCAQRFPTGIYMLAARSGGDDPSGFGTCYCLGAAQRHKLGDTSAGDWIAAGVELQTPAKLSAAGQIAFHFFFSLPAEQASDETVASQNQAPAEFPSILQDQESSDGALPA